MNEQATATNLCKEVCDEAEVKEGVCTELCSLGEATPSVTFDENDPETKIALAALVAREQKFFNQHRIQKRPDGTYWARLAVQPTQEQLTHGCSDYTSGYIHNRGELVKYFEKNLEKLNKRQIPLCFNSVIGVEYHELSIVAKLAQLKSPPAEHIFGYLSNLRIKNYGTHKEVHADFKLMAAHAMCDATKMPQICPSTMLNRTDVHLYWADQIVSFNIFYFDKAYTLDEVGELLAGQWTTAVKQALSK